MVVVAPLPGTPLELEDVLESIGVVVTKIDEERIHGYCPGHEQRVGRPDRHPSWSISRVSLIHHCFGCGLGGTLGSLLLSAGVSVWDTWGITRKLLGSSERLERSMRPGRRTSAVVMVEETLDEFDEPPPGALRKRDITAEACCYYSVRWDTDDSAWILPLRRPTGELLGWQAKAPEWVRNYPPGVVKGDCLFGLYEYVRSGCTDPLVLVESPLDVLRLWVANIDSGVSSYGVGVSKRQMELCLEHCSHIILALDNDEAGRSMTKQLVTGTRYDSRGREHKLPTRWHGRLTQTLYNYGDSVAKDPGDQTDEEIWYGIDNALPGAVAVKL